MFGPHWDKEFINNVSIIIMEMLIEGEHLRLSDEYIWTGNCSRNYAPVDLYKITFKRLSGLWIIAWALMFIANLIHFIKIVRYRYFERQED